MKNRDRKSGGDHGGADDDAAARSHRTSPCPLWPSPPSHRSRAAKTPRVRRTARSHGKIRWSSRSRYMDPFATMNCMCSDSFCEFRNECRRRSMHACSSRRGEKRIKDSAHRSSENADPAGHRSRHRPRLFRFSRSSRCNNRRCSSFHCGLRSITCPSSLNCMIAAAFCMRSRSLPSAAFHGPWAGKRPSAGSSAWHIRSA